MKLSLKYRIAVVILLLEAVMMAMVLWQTLGYSLESSRSQLAVTEQTMLDLVSNIGRVALLTEEYADLQPYLENLRHDPRIIKVILADSRLRIVASTHAADTGMNFEAIVKTHETKEHFWRQQVISNSAGTLGKLAIGFSNKTLLNAYAEARNLGISIAAFGMAITAIFGLLTGYLLTRRLEKVNQAATLVAAGDLSARAAVGGRDEVAALGQVFDSMVQTINKDRMELEKREQYLSLTLDSIGDAVIATDADGNITRMNPIAVELTGWSNAEARNHPLPEVFNIINAHSRESVSNPVEKVLSSGKIVGLANHTVLISKHGTEYQIADSAAPIRDENSSILGVILVFRDVSSQYQTEEALRRSQKMEAIGQLSGGIAHDFNNQLGIIIGYLDFLQSHVENDKQAGKWVHTASRATLRCIDLTRQLLAFSRKQGKEKKVVDINSTLRELETVVSRSITPEVEVQYFLIDDLWLTEIDPGEFQDAVLNLVINARDAMPGGGKLLIETSNKYLDTDYAGLNPEIIPGDYVQLMLSDTGTGMDNETLEHVFEPFYTTKPEGKGTGLGMAMVYGFIKRYEGYIKIYSEPGAGTTMRLYLPRSTQSKASTPTDKNYADKLPVGNEVILIVDDEVDLLQLAEQFLSDLGYHTLVAENAAQALEILSKDQNIDLLFSDVVMPGGMNGYELAKQASQQRAELKVLMTSGFTSKIIAHNGLARFASKLLSKPYRKIELAQRIRQALDES